MKREGREAAGLHSRHAGPLGTNGDFTCLQKGLYALSETNKNTADRGHQMSMTQAAEMLVALNISPLLTSLGSELPCQVRCRGSS